MSNGRDVGVNSDTFARLSEPMQWQAQAVASLLRKNGAYIGSESDALTDAVGIVLALRYSPEGDNHHNAMQCPYCNPAGGIKP